MHRKNSDSLRNRSEQEHTTSVVPYLSFGDPSDKEKSQVKLNNLVSNFVTSNFICTDLLVLSSVPVNLEWQILELLLERFFDLIRTI